MVGRSTGLRQHGDHVFERLLELRHQVLATKLLLFVPADLTGDEHNASGSDCDSVGVSDGRRPTLRQQNRHETLSSIDSNMAPPGAAAFNDMPINERGRRWKLNQGQTNAPISPVLLDARAI
jgi:hypothetical protein